MLPYQPTIVLAPNSSLVYVLDASNAASPSLYSLDTSSHLDGPNLASSTSSKIDLTTISNSGAKALLPVINQEGGITLLAGTCGLGGNQIALYTLNGNGNSPLYTSVQASSGQGQAPYLGYLSAAWQFGASVYTFGGMCPNSTGLTAANWQDSATYSASLNQLSSSSSDASAMVFGSVSGSMPLVPEAGFSVTPLSPQLSKASGSGISQDFMWIGGQTQTAFINMSALAVYSLPGNTWSAISVTNPSNASAPEPRSGHTATLSSDGNSVVVVGGWVGDINTPAQPQVAVLQRTSGSGIASQWQWVVPTNSTSIPSSIMQNGIYGHGATMLNGDTLMLVGGQSASSSSKRKRQASSASIQFYNYVQNSWATTYSNPGTASTSPTSVSSAASSAAATSMASSVASSVAASITGSATSAATSASTNSTSNETNTGLSAGQKAGIAIGVILGIVALLLLVSYLNIKFLKRSKREPSEKDTAALPWSKYDKNEKSNFSVLPNSMRPVSLHSNDYPWAPVMGEDWDEKSALPSIPTHKESNNAARTGVLVEIPSPTRGLRKGAHARNSQYYPTWRDETARPGNIHRIDEAREEEEQEGEDPFKSPVSNQRQSFMSAPPLDNPFQDPLGSHPVLSPRPHSPTSPLARSHEMEGWMSDWAKADAILQGNPGRVSPTKSDRPTSLASGASGKTETTSSTEARALIRGAAKRGISGRGLRRKPLPQFPITSPSTEPVKRMMGPGRPLPAKPTTAAPRPTLNHLQVPQTEYLGAGVEAGRLPPRSPSHVQRVRTWMDNMRSVLGSTRAVAPPPPIIALPQPETSSAPRRAATAIPWQPRKGARDWDVDITDAAQQHQPLYNKQDEDEDDWDVEGAVQNRVVQMMFTMPRDKIRVVNAHEGDSVSLSSAGGGDVDADEKAEGDGEVEHEQFVPLRRNMI